MSGLERGGEPKREEGAPPESGSVRENQPPVSSNGGSPIFRRTTPLLATLGVLVGPLVCAGLWMLVVSPRSDQGQTETDAEAAIRILQEVREEDQKILNNYDLSKTPIRIPITRAMALIAQEEETRAAGASKDNPNETNE